jgi:hypothetical protein
MKNNHPLGLTSVVIAVSALSGCGGTSFVQAVPTTLNFATTDSANTQIVVTRSNRVPGAGQECTLSSQPEWCSNPSIQELRFEVQPSFTLYRAYVVNTSPNDRVCSIRVTRKGTNETYQKVVPANSTVWFWELGIDTVERR